MNPQIFRDEFGGYCCKIKE
jgi:hypothetical protein